MKTKPWWYRMAEMRSYTIVVAMFSRYWQKYKDFRAIKRTADEYPYADIHTVTKMLEDLRIIDTLHGEIKYDLNQLADVVEYMVDYEQEL